MKNKNFFLATSALLIMVITLASAGMPADEFKNLQVLPKNISAEALDKIMDEFKAGLGVNCGYCHAKRDDMKHLDFASDAKPEKEIARKMMRMTIDLNKRYFGDSVLIKTVSCFTCHHGNPVPVASSTDIRLNVN